MAIAPVASQAAKSVISPGTSVTRAFPNNVSTNSLVVCYGIKYSSSSDVFVVGDFTKSAGTATITDAQLHGQHQVDDGSGGLMAVAIWSARVTAGGSLTMQMAGMLAGTYGVLIVEEYTGNFGSTRATSPAATGGTGNNNQTAASSGNVTLSGAGMIVGVLGLSTAIAGFSMAEDGAFTSIQAETDGSTNMVGEAIRRIVTSGTTDDASWTIDSNNTGWLAVAVGFFEAAGGVSGSGTPVAPAATAAGSGTRGAVGTGAATAPLPTVSGSGAVNASSNNHVGTGALTIPPAISSGTAVRGTSDLGGAVSLVAPLPTVSGTGTVESGTSEITGSGALTNPKPTASGLGKRGIHGSGALTIALPIVAGIEGPIAVTGTGALSPRIPFVTATGVRRITGTGVLVCPLPVTAGFGPSDSEGEFSQRIPGVNPTRKRAVKYAHGWRGRWQS